MLHFLFVAILPAEVEFPALFVEVECPGLLLSLLYAPTLTLTLTLQRSDYTALQGDSQQCSRCVW